MEISKDKKVTINYIGTFENKEVFDDSYKRGEPLKFLIGHKNIIFGLEKELINLKEGDEKKIEVEPKEGYGEYNEGMVQEFDKKSIPQNIDVKVGTILQMQDPNTQQIFNVIVKEILENSYKIDFNHPLAGKKLIFEIKVEKVEEALKEELEKGHILN